MKKKVLYLFYLILIQMVNYSFVIGDIINVPVISQSERQALLELYKNTNGDNWLNRSNWKNDYGTECSWYGVYCSETGGEVIKIKMTSNRLSGKLPDKLTNLKYLKELDLSDNSISGTIHMIAELKDLQILKLSKNLFFDEIPSALLNHQKIEEIHLGSNKLFNNIPDVINTESNLRIFNIALNRISGNIPDHISNFSKLNQLRINGNTVKGEIPRSILLMSSLLNAQSDFRWNALFTNSEAIKSFLNQKQMGGMWDKTQAVAPINFQAVEVKPYSVKLQWSPIDFIVTDCEGYYYIYYNDLSTDELHVKHTQNIKQETIEIGNLDPGKSYSFYLQTAINCLIDEDNNQYEHFVLSNYSKTITVTTINPDFIPKSENKALRDLFLLTDGDNWENNAGWKQGVYGTECNWTGITCTPNQNAVIEIKLPGNNLSGNINESIGDFAQLKTIDLSNNSLQGNLPETIEQLKQLETLNLSFNQLTGNIPSEIKNLPQLTILDLSHNTLNSTIPQGLFQHPHLKYLNLGYNELNCLFSEIIDYFDNFQSNLTQLDLQYNQIEGEIPAELLVDNPLEEIYLGHNQLTGSIESLFTSKNEVLKIFDISNNHFNGKIPEQIVNLESLQKLLINGNMFIGDIPVSIMEIQYLSENESDFRWNALRTDSKKLTSFLNNKQINGSWNNFQTVSPENIQVIDAGANYIKLQWSIINYQDAEGYYEIYQSVTKDGGSIYCGQTKSKSQNTFEVTGLVPNCTYYFKIRTTTLKNLLHNQNEVKSDFSLPITAKTTTGFSAIERQALIDLFKNTNGKDWKNNDNWVSDYGTECNWFGVYCDEGKKHVIQLLLGNNNLSSSRLPDMNVFEKLTVLDMSDNNIRGDIEKQFDELTMLEDLNLKNNILKGDIKSFETLHNLKKLNIFDNEFKGDIKNLLALEYIEELIIGKNAITGQIPKEINTFKNLKILNINGNMLIGEIPVEITHLENLHELDLRWNALIATERILRRFINAKHIDEPWEETQTIACSSMIIDEKKENSLVLIWKNQFNYFDSDDYTGEYEIYYKNNEDTVFHKYRTIDKNDIKKCKIELNPEMSYFFAIKTIINSHDNNKNIVTSLLSDAIPDTYSNVIDPMSINREPLNEKSVSCCNVALAVTQNNYDEILLHPIAAKFQIRLSGTPYGCNNCSYPLSLYEFLSYTSSNFYTYHLNKLSDGMKYYWSIGVAFEENRVINYGYESAFKVGTITNKDYVSIPPCRDERDFKIISFTQWPVKPVSTEVFSYIDYDSTRYKIGTIDPVSNQYIEFGENLLIEPGKAYWFFARKGMKLNIDGVAVSGNKDIYIELSKGKNMIACPNNKSYRWDMLELGIYQNNNMKTITVGNQDAEKYIDKQLMKWNGITYVETETMKPFEGYWLNVKENNVFLKFIQIASLTNNETFDPTSERQHNNDFSNISMPDGFPAPPAFSDHHGISTQNFQQYHNEVQADKMKRTLHPSILFTDIPSFNNYIKDLKGKVVNVSPDNFKIVVFIFVSDYGWRIKPYPDEPYTYINNDGSWQCDITTEAYDHQATTIKAYLLPKDFQLDNQQIKNQERYHLDAVDECTVGWKNNK